MDVRCSRDRLVLPRYVLGLSSIAVAQSRSTHLRHASQPSIAQEHHDFHLLLPALQACTALRDLEMGDVIANLPSTSSSSSSNVFVASSIVTMYARCARMDLAKRAFEEMGPRRDVVAWNSLLLGYARNGHPELALELFSRMEETNAGSFVAAIKACSGGIDRDSGGSSAFLDRGIAIHRQARRAGCDANVFVANAIVDFYCKAGRLIEARGVFDAMPQRSASSWNALMLGFAENGLPEVAIELFHRCCAVDSRGFVAAIKACSMLDREGSLEAMEIGRIAGESGMDRESFVANGLVDMYAKCGAMAMARRIFDAMEEKDVVSWTALIAGYGENGEEAIALDAFDRFHSPNELTFVAALKACSRLSIKEEESSSIAGMKIKMGSLARAMRIHARAWRSGLGTNTLVATTLIDLYARCGSLLDARIAFDRMELHSAASWNAMMLGYVDHGQARVALELFSSTGGAADARGSIVAAIKACGELGLLDRGVEIHARAAELGLALDGFVASALVEMYAKCGGGGVAEHRGGGLAEARKLCDALPAGEFVPWTRLMVGYAESGEEEVALEIFARLRLQRPPDPQLFLAALSACGAAAALDTARAIHADLSRSGLESYVPLANSLIDVHGKCGDLAAAQRLFDSSRSSSENLMAWTALLGAYGREGESRRVLELFGEMVDEGVKPDGVALLCVLAACSHAGLVHSGERCFHAMASKFGIVPGTEHYVCMVDMLCRANQVEAAVEMARSMTLKPRVLIWRTILGACQRWKNAELGKLAFDALVELDRDQAVAYVFMRNMYQTTLD